MADEIPEFICHRRLMGQLHVLIVEKWQSQTVSENQLELTSILEALKICDDSVRCEHCGNRPTQFCQTSQFLHKCLLILQNACAVYRAGQEKTEQTFDVLLSIQDKKQLDYLLFFLVKVGISRHLFFHVTTLSLNFDEPPEPTPCGCKALLQTIRHLLQSCDHEYVQNKLSCKYLLDILAGVMQLAYSPQARQMLSAAERKSCQSLLNYVLAKWSKLVDLVKCLLALQGGPSTPSPLWLKQSCGMLLSKALLLPGGVFATVKGISASLDVEMSECKKAEIVLKILTTSPRSGPSSDEYCTIVCNQIFEHIQSSKTDKGESQLADQILVESIFALYEKHPKLVGENFFAKQFAALQILATDSTGSPHAQGEFDVNRSLEQIHVVFARFRFHISNKREAIIKELVPYVEILFNMFKWTRYTICAQQTILREIIISILNECPIDYAVGVLLALCNISTPSNQHLDMYEMRSEVFFSLTDDGEIAVSEQETEHSPEGIVMEQDKVVQSIINLVELSQNKGIGSSFFITMLKLLSDLQTIDVAQPSSSLQTAEDRAVEHLIAGESQLIIYALIMAFLENCHPTTLLSDISQISEFMKVMLHRVLEYREEDVSVENLKLTFAILGLCLMCEVDSTKQQPFQEIVQLLQSVSQLSWLDQTDQDTATDLAIAIATHGKGVELDVSMFSASLQAGVKNLSAALDGHDEDTNMDVDNEEKIVASKINANKKQRPSANVEPVVNGRNMSDQVTDTFQSMQLQSVDEAIGALFDPSPPERAAAVRFLTNLIKNGNANAPDEQGKLYELFVERLKLEEDSFVYLSLLQGLFEIVSKGDFADKNMCNLVLKLFDDYSKCLAKRTERDELNATKIGEVLVRLVGRLGDMGPHYGKRLAPLFLVGCRHSSALVRSSSLSNLAELCPLLRHRVAEFEHELTSCLTSIAKTDEAEPRRAAVFAIRRLIEVLGCDILQVLPGSMKALYEALKVVYARDEDGAARLHAQLALEALESVMKTEVFAKPRAQGAAPAKKIVVLPP